MTPSDVVSAFVLVVLFVWAQDRCRGRVPPVRIGSRLPERRAAVESAMIARAERGRR